MTVFAPRNRHAARALVLAALVLLGCAGDLPLQELIVDTRPLAIRIEVEDPMAPPDAAVRAEALPLQRVQLIPFIVDDAAPLAGDRIAAEIEPVWIACTLQPIRGLFSCLPEALPLDPQALSDCPPADPGSFDPTGSELPTFPSPCRLPTTGLGRTEFMMPIDVSFLLGGSLEVTMVGHQPSEGTTDACLQALLSQSDRPPQGCIFATQRVAVGPDGALLQLAQQFGIPNAESFGVIPDEIPEPDANPRIESFQVEVFDAQERSLGATAVERGDVIEVQAGHRIELETTAPESDLQTYLIPRDMTSFEQRTETYQGAWFRTWGDLLSPSSNDPRSVNTWTLRPGEQDELERPPEDRATLYYILRDDRQGVDWWWFHIDVQ
jgi:hypothetical protein